MSTVYLTLAATFVALAFALTARGGSSAFAVASWYGPGLYGNTMACGGTLTTGTLGVAHKTLRCGTRVVVCFRRRCARVRVVDRGPFVRGRTFDLTAATARRIGFSGVQTIYWRRA